MSTDKAYKYPDAVRWKTSQRRTAPKTRWLYIVKCADGSIYRTYSSEDAHDYSISHKGSALSAKLEEYV